LLVAFNIILVSYGLLIGGMLSPIWDWIEPRLIDSAAPYLKFIRILVETILATLIVLIVLFVSKAFFRSRRSGILQNNFVSRFADMIYWLFAGVSDVIVNFSQWMLKYFFNIKINSKLEVFSKIDLEHFLQQSKLSDEVEPSDINQEMFENALSLKDVKLRECLIPRKEIVSLNNHSTIDEVKALFIKTKLSKLVIYENNIDTIIGYVHQLDMFTNPESLSDILYPIPTVPASMSATDLMNKFSKERKSIAWVIDEFGGTAGIVTMEDLLEEIFGDIQDEYDSPEIFIEKQLSENEFVFSGRLELDYIEEKYKITLPEAEQVSETLSGYIIQHNESIPKEKDRIISGNFEFYILSVSDTRIETVKLKILN
ncbi:MAG: hemolysin family protein, partial [Ferruginibacter sp.]